MQTKSQLQLISIRGMILLAFLFYWPHSPSAYAACGADCGEGSCEGAIVCLDEGYKKGCVGKNQIEVSLEKERTRFGCDFKGKVKVTYRIKCNEGNREVFIHPWHSVRLRLYKYPQQGPGDHPSASEVSDLGEYPERTYIGSLVTGFGSNLEDDQPNGGAVFPEDLVSHYISNNIISHDPDYCTEHYWEVDLINDDALTQRDVITGANRVAYADILPEGCSCDCDDVCDPACTDVYDPCARECNPEPCACSPDPKSCHCNPELPECNCCPDGYPFDCEGTCFYASLRMFQR